MYEVKQIEGKGLGFVAVKNISKGSLILKETPQRPRVKGVEAPNPKVQGSIEAQEKALKIWIRKVHIFIQGNESYRPGRVHEASQSLSR
jgi:hypothetical protein